MIQDKMLKLIKERRSIRYFTNEIVKENDIMTLIEAAQWAPSGLNNQPWKFVTIQDKDILERCATCTKYSRILLECSSCIAVFYALAEGYNRDKDLMSIGACIQNMLLMASSMGIGTVWLGEILNKKAEVNEILTVDESYELAAVIALGYPKDTPQKGRKDLESLIIKRL